MNANFQGTKDRPIYAIMGFSVNTSLLLLFELPLLL